MRNCLLATAVAMAVAGSPLCARAQATVGSIGASQINQPNGVAGLDGSSHLPIGQIPTGPGANQVATGSSVAAINAFATIAAAGANQGAATPVSAATNYVTATATSLGVILVAAYPNARIINISSYPILIYPPSGGAINGGAANASVSLSGSASCAGSGTAWTCG